MHKKFTLIELLLVMLIVGVILSLSVVGLEKLINAQSLSTATIRLSDAAQLARNTAITNGTYVALLLPMTEEFQHEGVEAARSFRVCEVTEENDVYTFKSWYKGNEWEKLPPGVVIAGALVMDQRADVDVEDGSQDIDDTDYLVDVNVIDDSLVITLHELQSGYTIIDVEGSVEPIITSNMVGIVFNKYGNIVNSTNTSILLTEGFVTIAPEDFNDNEELTFRFKNTFIEGSDTYLGSWAEMVFDQFTGSNKIRFRGEEK